MRIDATELLFLLLFIITQGQAQDAATKPLSPQLDVGQNRIFAGDNTAVDAFWNQVARDGAPLIERVPDVNNHVLVTFLYRGKETTRNVAIIGGFVVGWQPEERFVKDQAMARLGDYKHLVCE